MTTVKAHEREYLRQTLVKIDYESNQTTLKNNRDIDHIYDIDSDLTVRMISDSLERAFQAPKFTETIKSSGSKSLCHDHHFYHRGIINLMSSLNDKQKLLIKSIYFESEKSINIHALIDILLNELAPFVPKNEIQRQQYKTLYTCALLNYMSDAIEIDKKLSHAAIARAMSISKVAFYKTWIVRYRSAFCKISDLDADSLNSMINAWSKKTA